MKTLTHAYMHAYTMSCVLLCASGCASATLESHIPTERGGTGRNQEDISFCSEAPESGIARIETKSETTEIDSALIFTRGTERSPVLELVFGTGAIYDAAQSQELNACMTHPDAVALEASISPLSLNTLEAGVELRTGAEQELGSNVILNTTLSSLGLPPTVRETTLQFFEVNAVDKQVCGKLALLASTSATESEPSVESETQLQDTSGMQQASATKPGDTLATIRFVAKADCPYSVD